jgi:hypothetical protein
MTEGDFVSDLGGQRLFTAKSAKFAKSAATSVAGGKSQISQSRIIDPC